MLESAVENAKANVELNKDRITEGKCDFFAGRAENLLPDIVKEYSRQGKKIIGIVDPPRSGLHPTVLKLMRTCIGLDLSLRPF